MYYWIWNNLMQLLIHIISANIDLDSCMLMFPLKISRSCFVLNIQVLGRKLSHAHRLSYVHGSCLVLWCLTPLLTIIQLYRGDQFYWWRQTRENHRPVPSHWQTYHIMLYRAHLVIHGIRTHNFSNDKHWLHR